LKKEGCCEKKRERKLMKDGGHGLENKQEKKEVKKRTKSKADRPEKEKKKGKRKKKKREEKKEIKENGLGPKLIWTLKAQWLICYGHPLQAQSELGPDESKAQFNLGPRHIQSHAEYS
jgi:hypothetical protein